MAHKRTTLRNAIVAALTGETFAGSRVYNSRILPEMTDGPSIYIYTLVEDIANRHDIQWQNTRSVKATVQLKIIAGSNDTFADDIDNVAEQVQALLSSKIGDVTDFIYQGFSLALEVKGAKPFGIGTMTYEAIYLHEGII